MRSWGVIHVQARGYNGELFGANSRDEFVGIECVVLDGGASVWARPAYTVLVGGDFLPITSALITRDSITINRNV
jgi:hypothetical protein